MSTETELRTILSGICRSDKQLPNLIKNLEGNVPNIGADTSDFYKAYVIFIFRKYCHSLDDRELMLAACGLLQGDGFQEENMEDRIKAYWRYSHDYSKHFKRIKAERNAPRKARTEMRRIMDYLDEDLNTDKNKNKGKLGLIDEVRKKWGTNGLRLPRPREIEATTPDVPTPEQPDNNITDPEENEQKVEENTVLHQEQEFVKPREIEESPDDGSSPDTGESIKKIKLFIECLKKFIDPKDAIKILISLFMAIMLWKIEKSLKDSQDPHQHTETASDTSTTENDMLTITGITIHNAEITLTPDKTWEELKVSIYPREANIDDVQYGSENAHLVVVDRSERVVVALASEWQKEAERSTKVHAQFGEIDEKVLVTVQENTINDKTTDPDGSTLDGNDSINTGNIPEF